MTRIQIINSAARFAARVMRQGVMLEEVLFAFLRAKFLARERQGWPTLLEVRAWVAVEDASGRLEASQNGLFNLFARADTWFVGGRNSLGSTEAVA